MKILAAIAVLCVAGTFAFYWADTPIHSVVMSNNVPCEQGNNCAACHKGSAPRTHVPQFIKTGHGPAASHNRQRCFTCHKRESCDDCHLKTAPAWHTEAFRHPAKGCRQRDEHALIATGHRSACMECHAQRFQDQCATCHRPDEEKLELNFLD